MDMLKDTTVSKNDPNITTKDIPKGIMFSKKQTKSPAKNMPKGTTVSKNDLNYHKRHAKRNHGL